jgi:hypothetical protein
MIGFIAEEPYPRHIKHLYEETARVDLSDEDFYTLSESLR